MKIFARACLKAGLAIMLLVPHTTNDLVVNDHLIVGLVAIVLCIWAIFDVTVEEDREHAQLREYYDLDKGNVHPDLTKSAILRNYARKHDLPIIDVPLKRTDYQSSELKRLFSEEGSFSSLNKRHR